MAQGDWAAHHLEKLEPYSGRTVSAAIMRRGGKYMTIASQAPRARPTSCTTSTPAWISSLGPVVLVITAVQP